MKELRLTEVSSCPDLCWPLVLAWPGQAGLCLPYGAEGHPSLSVYIIPVKHNILSFYSSSTKSPLSSEPFSQPSPRWETPEMGRLNRAHPLESLESL